MAGLLVGLLVVACAHAPTRGAGRAGAGVEWVLPDRLVGTQHLFRVTVSGPRASGSGRLALVLATLDRYQLRTTDALGRALWSFELVPAGWLLVDPRSERYCRGSAGPALPEIDLGVLPPAALPAVLLGFLPAAPATIDASSATLDWLDASGRRWTARRDGARAVAWTRWQDGRPLAWWTRVEDGGILSHRNGVQVRWREVAGEPLPGPVAALSPPVGYREASCDELDLPEFRQDQPSPAGGGAPR
ncbi:MAG: hypothetical protein ACRD0X_01640 [Thermoanaerobaculia bacterium]